MTAYDALLETVRMHGAAFHPLTAREPTEEYLKRLAKAVSGVTKRMFDDMPTAAQEWFDAAATALAESTPVPLPEGFSRDTKVAKPVEEQVAKPPPPRIKRPTGSAIPPREPVPPRPVPPPKPPQITAPADPVPIADEPVTTRVARLLIADENQTLPGLIRVLKGQGMKVNDDTIRMARYNVLRILQLVRQAGWQPPA